MDNVMPICRSTSSATPLNPVAATTTSVLLGSRPRLHLNVDAHTLELDPDRLPHRIPNPRIVAVELPGDPAPRPVQDARSFLNAMPAAMSTSPSRCGSIKGVRILRRGATGKRIVYFPSLKNAASMQCESRLEALHAMAVEGEPDVVAYRLQPFRIHFDGWHYTPDAIVQKLDGTIAVHEVKPFGKLECTELTARLAVVQLALHRFGTPFHIRTERYSGIPSMEFQVIYQRMNKNVRADLLRSACISALQISSVWRLSDLHLHFVTLGFGAGNVERLIWDGLLTYSGRIGYSSTVMVRSAR